MWGASGCGCLTRGWRRSRGRCCSGSRGGGCAAWDARAEVYDIRLSVSGWRLRVEATLERVELASGRYKLWLRTPGKVELESSQAASALLMGVLRAGAGRAAVRALAEKLLPPG